MGSLIALALNSGSSSLELGLYRVDSAGAEKLFGESVSTAEHPDAMKRAQICAGLSWLGVSLDDARNRAATHPSSDGAARCQVLVLASQEDEQIARHAWALLA